MNQNQHGTVWVRVVKENVQFKLRYTVLKHITHSCTKSLFTAHQAFLSREIVVKVTEFQWIAEHQLGLSGCGIDVFSQQSQIDVVRAV